MRRRLRHLVVTNMMGEKFPPSVTRSTKALRVSSLFYLLLAPAGLFSLNYHIQFVALVPFSCFWIGKPSDLISLLDFKPLCYQEIVLQDTGN